MGAGRKQQYRQDDRKGDESFFEEGIYVEEGQLLARLDDGTMIADLNYSQSQLNEQDEFLTEQLAKEELASQASLDAARAAVEGLEA